MPRLASTIAVVGGSRARPGIAGKRGDHIVVGVDAAGEHAVEPRFGATQLGDEVEHLTAVGKIGNRVADDFWSRCPAQTIVRPSRTGSTSASPRHSSAPFNAAGPRPGSAGRAALRQVAAAWLQPRRRRRRRGRRRAAWRTRSSARVVVCVHPHESVTEMEMVGPDPIDERVEQHFLEHAPMDRQLRPG